MLCFGTLVALLAVSQGAPQYQPWVLMQQAAIKVSENVDKDAAVRFPNMVPFEQQWADFKNTNNKQYEEADEVRRRDIFRMNLQHIEVHNYMFSKGEKSYSLGVNEYADMDVYEFVKVMNGLLPRNKNSTEHGGATYLSPNVPLTLPDTVDWRDKGYVTPIKNQGQCGSCWSFSSTGSLEGQHFRKSGKLVSLSEQNLVDCSTKWGNHGCQGGLMDNAFRYIHDNKGDDTEMSYPYEAKDGVCRFKRASVGATDKGFFDVTSGDEDKLKEATATVGPVSVAIDASHRSFQLYRSGVYDEPECSSTALDHGVLVVGYGTEESDDYWLVKNSWGTTWGDQGYVKMARNKDNQCGVASQASYPLV